MHVLVVTAHPDAASFTHAVARQVIAGIEAHPGHTGELADIAAEGFDPRFTAADHAHFQGQGAADPGILAEQQRIDRAGLLVLVFPIYWWAMPALLKGWIDRVFIQGWAFDIAPDGGISRRLGRLPVQLVGLGGGDAGTYARHGYAEAMRRQIDHGIFGYCGAPVVGSELLLHADAAKREAALRRARAIGGELVAGRSQGQGGSVIP